MNWTLQISATMSTSYNVEPPPTAEVLLHTTAGQIHLEIFAKQTPLTSRNFLQHCLNGYYDGTIFHRLVPGFVLQGGDPTGTGEGGEAIYDDGVFADEFHSRLRFNRRGLLGMANTGRKDDNGSQFFFTLGKTEELDGVNTMFGRVVGDSIYAVMKMAEAELLDVEGSERPMYPTSITRTEVLVNPFEDMVAKKVVRVAPTKSKEPAKKKAKKKGGKALLSFGMDEEGDDGGEPVFKKPKFNPKLVASTSVAREEPLREENLQSEPAVQKSVEANPSWRRDSSPRAPDRLKQNRHPETQLPLPNDEEPSKSPLSSPEPENVRRVSSALERTNAQIAELKASMRRNIPTAALEPKQKKSALEQLIPANVIRGRKRKQGGNDGGKGEAATLKMISAFRAKLDQAEPEVEKVETARNGDLNGEKAAASPKAAEGDEEEEARLCDLHFIANCQSCKSWDEQGEGGEDYDANDKSWMSHSLSFEKDRLGKDLTWKRKNEEELVVIDPREKARDIKEEQKAKKLARQGGNRRDRRFGGIPERTAGARS